jgi:hypothetical protein
MKLFSLLLSGCLLAPALASDIRADEARLVAVLRDARLNEISGMVTSRLHAGVLWVHNDSDGPAELFAIDVEGKVLATVLLDGAENRDWEDITAFERDGISYLMIADTGDNGGLRSSLELAVVKEPESLVDQTLPLAWTQRFRWPDGPRDTEAVGVDPHDDHVYLISKKRVPAELWRLALGAENAARTDVAERVGALTGIAQPSAEDLKRNPVFGRYRSQITGMDISRDGLRMAVLNYRTAYVYQRSLNEPWSAALSRVPLEIPYPWMAQAEGITWSANGQSLWIGTERLPAPLIEISLDAGLPEQLQQPDR